MIHHLTLFVIAFFLFINCNLKDEERNVFIEEEIVAIVNNKKISSVDFEKGLKNFLHQIPLLKQQYKSNPAKVKKFVLNKLIAEELILQEANRKNIIIDDEVVNQQTNNILSGSAHENIAIALKNQNSTTEQWLDGFKNDLIITRIIEKEVIDKIRITKKEVSDYFKKNKRKFVISKQHEVLHILVKTKETAEIILELLNKKNASFEDLVSIYSIAADKRNSGNLGFVQRNELPEELNKAIFSLRSVGRLSKITQTNFGYHIFKLKSIKPRQTKELSQVREQIVKKLKANKSKQAIQDWFTKLKANSTIIVYDKV